jgi:hypothetical protein
VNRLKRDGQPGALSDQGIAQGDFRQQIGLLTDMLRQLAGNPNVAAGNTAQADPLSAPFTLYVNPYIGSDRFVGGSYNTFEEGANDDEIIAAKLKRLELQRLECGYTPQRPFRTINRAVIEAAIITSKNWYTYNDPKAHLDCVSIVLAAAVHTLYNDPGSASTSWASWGAEKDPTIAELIAFNPAAEGGILLPRGCSIWSPDLRKTTLRPSWVPAVADEAADYSNRRGIFKVTGSGFAFGFTFMDKIGLAASHHLLDCFHFASKAELDAFYAKTFSAVGSGADLSATLTATRPSEYEIVGPIEQNETPSADWDTTKSASFYVFNCSIRSEYGLGGIWADGAKVNGLRSIVTAQFTGVSLQKDMCCWQRYDAGNWTTTTYEQFIQAGTNNVRMNPARLSRHISAINNAFIQEVSVFAIGQGVHHFTDKGGEITTTNSSSSFGGCSAVSKGYKGYAFLQDKGWSVYRVRVPQTPAEDAGRPRKVALGKVADITTSGTITLTLDVPLETGIEPAVPELLRRNGWSLKQGTYIWVGNPAGGDYRALLAANAWSAATPNQITLSAVPVRSDNGAALTPEIGVGLQIYLRRLSDRRTLEERLCQLELINTSSTRLPVQSFVLQTDPARVDGGITRVLNPESELLIVMDCGSASFSAGITEAVVTLRRDNVSRTYANGAFYRRGETVLSGNKRWRANRDVYASTPTPAEPDFTETLVHMPTAYKTGEVITAKAPRLVFDTDTDPADGSLTLGINWTTMFTNAGTVRDLYRSGTDYLGAYAFLRYMGFTDAAAHTALLPRAKGARSLDPTSALDFPTAPSGGASGQRANWAVEFRRPSVLRLYGHAWEWAGWLNYSKSLPAAQKAMTVFNKFTYYFTNWNGGQVVAQGSNEDGFNVTPRGLENVETGDELALDDLGAVDIGASSNLENISIENLTVSGNLDLTGVDAITLDPSLLPYLPLDGSPTADVRIRSLSINQAIIPGYAFALNGASAANVVDLGTGSTIDCRLSNSFLLLINGARTLVFNNPPPSGQAYAMELSINFQSGSITWPASVRWPGGIPPVFSTAQRARVRLTTLNAGARWEGDFSVGFAV